MIYTSEEVWSHGAIVIASIVTMVIVFTRLFRHLLNWNGLRMSQISAMIKDQIWRVFKFSMR